MWSYYLRSLGWLSWKAGPRGSVFLTEAVRECGTCSGVLVWVGEECESLIYWDGVEKEELRSGTLRQNEAGKIDWGQRIDVLAIQTKNYGW